MSLPKWKKARNKIIFCFVAFLLCCFLVSKLFFLYKESKLFHQDRVTVVFSSDQNLVVSFSSSTSPVFILLKDGANVKETLRIPVDGEIGNWKLETGSWKLEEIKKELGNLKTLKELRQWKTDLTILDLVKIWWKIKTASANKIELFDFRDEKIGLLLSGLFKDSDFVREGLLIEVLNAGLTPQLAGKAADVIKNLGGRVISTKNQESEIEKCQIKAEKKSLQSKTAKRLKEIFNCVLLEEKLLDSRADLQLIIKNEF